MAPRANWKGFLRLSLMTRPVALYPATSESEKISFNQLNRQTGHRIIPQGRRRYGDEVANEDIVKGYALEKDTFIEVSKEEPENVALEPTTQSCAPHGPTFPALNGAHLTATIAHATGAIANTGNADPSIPHCRDEAPAMRIGAQPLEGPGAFRSEVRPWPSKGKPPGRCLIIRCQSGFFAVFADTFA